MKQIAGIWLPDTDQHFGLHLNAGPMVDGKGTYQFAKYQAALKHVLDRGHAVDVGAHIGTWSRVMAKDFRQVTAFEPVAEHVECFEANVKAENVTLLNCAVGAEPGQAGLILVEDNSGNARLTDGADVIMVTLDQPRMKKVDLLKIDVEGWERDVVLGAEMTIREDKPVVVVEQKPGHAERYGIGRWDAVNILKSWGMREVAVISGDHVMVF